MPAQPVLGSTRRPVSSPYRGADISVFPPRLSASFAGFPLSREWRLVFSPGKNLPHVGGSKGTADRQPCPIHVALPASVCSDARSLPSGQSSCRDSDDNYGGR